MPTRALRRFTLGFASALALAGAARAGEVTYPQLGTATTVQDTDLIATWRASGPLTKVQASVLEAYIQGKLGGSFLQTSNNLSELTATAATARGNLGLGSAALATTGTSGTALCQLNSNCTWTGTEAFNAAVTMGSTLSVTGATTLAGAATLNGGLTVSGVSFLADGAASAGGDYLIMRPTDFGPGKPEMFFRKIAGDNITWNMGSFDGATFGTGNLALTFANITQNGQLIVTSGEQITGSGLNVTGGFTLNSGPFTLPAGSVANADLDTVNGSPGSCGSATTTCTVTINGQGRATGMGSATIQPDTCVINNTSGYCKNPNGYVHQWYHFDSGAFNGWAGGPTSITFPFSPSHGCFSYSAITDNQGGQSSPWYALQVSSAPGGNSVTVSAAGFQSGGHNAIEGFYVSADCY